MFIPFIINQIVTTNKQTKNTYKTPSKQIKGRNLFRKITVTDKEIN